MYVVLLDQRADLELSEGPVVFSYKPQTVAIVQARLDACVCIDKSVEEKIIWVCDSPMWPICAAVL